MLVCKVQLKDGSTSYLGRCLMFDYERLVDDPDAFSVCWFFEEFEVDLKAWVDLRKVREYTFEEVEMTPRAKYWMNNWN